MCLFLAHFQQWKQWQTLFLGAPKSLQMVTAAMKLKESYDQPRQHIKKQRKINLFLQFAELLPQKNVGLFMKFM